MDNEYINTYLRRVNHLGRNPQERAFRSGLLEFERNLKYNEHKELLQRENGDELEGIILTDKQDENRVSQILCTRFKDRLAIGELIYWESAPWLIWRNTISSYQPYNKYYMVKCNYEVKWVDKGDLHKSWAYILGSKDSKIQDNFRTWNSLITPQPNKHIRIIMPKQSIPKGTEIIIGDENWYLVDYDIVSVPEIIFMSFTEGKYNELRDDLNDQLANADKLNKWEIKIAPETYVSQGEIIQPIFSISKNGIIQDITDITYVLGPGLKQNDDGTIVVEMAEGETSLIIKYKDVAEAYQQIHVGTTKENYAIVGNDTLRVTYQGIYEFKQANTQTSSLEVHFELENTKLASIVEQSGSTCKIQANNLNKTGMITLFVNYAGTRYEKQIKIISLWQQQEA